MMWGLHCANLLQGPIRNNEGRSKLVNKEICTRLKKTSNSKTDIFIQPYWVKIINNLLPHVHLKYKIS